MSRRKRRVSHANHDRWLVSYADFITLLFAFFVVLYASAQVDKRKVGKLALAIQVAFQEMGVFQASTTQVPVDSAEPMPFSTAQAIENTERTASFGRIASRPVGVLGSVAGNAGGADNGDLADLQKQLETALAPEIERQEIAMRREPDGLVISLREVGFFESGSALMKSTSQAAFDRVADLLRQREYRLRIEGHTDNVPIHTAQFPSNWELSTARATEIVRLLIVREGFRPPRLSAAGYADYHPVASNRTADGRGINRRVDIVILGRTMMDSAQDLSGTRTEIPAATPDAASLSQRTIPGPVDTRKPAAVSDRGGHLQQ
jgi:chemotaxis protein MotB